MGFAEGLEGWKGEADSNGAQDRRFPLLEMKVTDRLRGAQRICCRDGGQSRGQETVANPLLDEPHPHPIPYSSTELKEATPLHV